MTPQRFQEIRQFFELIVDLKPLQRSSALAEARSTDSELADEVEALISAYDRRVGFIERPVTSVHSTDILPAQPGTVIDDYELLELVGTGGMGEVWRAEQKHPVNRLVAIKLIKAGMDTREVVARFDVERQALALMDHPAIAKVLDGGSTPSGRPFFVMEFVTGMPITAYCDERKLTIRERAKLFVRVCEGVQHAHQKAIIHRDLKPSNILIAEVDKRAVPKIIDFGIARAMSQRLTAETFFTRAGTVLGTLDYMSPEQACSAGEHIDTRTDVYSLGVIFYQLMAGSLPLEFRKLPFDQSLRKLREDDPPRLSARVLSSGVAASRSADATALARQLRGDLDSIALKALAKDPARRYDTPAEFAADISRFLSNRPVEAHPPSFGYQAWKYCRRHYIPVTAAALVVVLAAVFAVAQAVQLRRVTRERDRADRIAAFMSSMFKVSDPGKSRGTQVTAREILDKASADITRGLSKDAVLQADMMDVMGDVYDNLGLYPQSEALLRRALEIHRTKLGRDDVSTANSLHLLSSTLYAEGRTEESEKLEKEALEIRRRRLGLENPDTLRTMNNIARVLLRSGKYAEAEKLHQQIFEIRRRVLGDEHPDTLVSMDSLGATLDDEGRYAEAEVIERNALRIKRRILGEDHPETLRTLHHLADTAYSQGSFAEAVKLHREELAIYERVLGPEHADTLNSMVALANALDDEGHFAEAEKLDRRALEIQLRTLGPEHYNTLVAMNNEAEILDDEGRHAEAAAMHRQVLAIRTRVLGPEHSHTLYTMSKLAWSLILMHHLDEAEKLSEMALEKQVRVLGPGHPETADTRYNLACIAAQRGQVDRAITELSDAVHHGLKPRAVLRFEKDANLKPLHGDARYTSLLAYARQQASHPAR